MGAASEQIFSQPLRQRRLLHRPGRAPLNRAADCIHSPLGPLATSAWLDQDWTAAITSAASSTLIWPLVRRSRSRAPFPTTPSCRSGLRFDQATRSSSLADCLGPPCAGGRNAITSITTLRCWHKPPASQAAESPTARIRRTTNSRQLGLAISGIEATASEAERPY